MCEVELDCGGETVRLTAAAGRLLDHCDEVCAPLVFSCRAGNCGVCRVRVETGAELLVPPSDDERLILDAAHANPGERLACQIVLRDANGFVRLAVPPASERGKPAASK